MQACYLRLSYDLNLIEYDINNTFLVFLRQIHSRYVTYDSVSSGNLIFNDTNLNVIVNATVSTNTLLHYPLSCFKHGISVAISTDQLSTQFDRVLSSFLHHILLLLFPLF